MKLGLHKCACHIKQAISLSQLTAAMQHPPQPSSARPAATAPVGATDVTSINAVLQEVSLVTCVPGCAGQQNCWDGWLQSLVVAPVPAQQPL